MDHTASIPHTETDHVSDEMWLAMSEAQRSLYLLHYIRRVDNNTGEIVKWFNNVRGGLAILRGLALLGGWCAGGYAAIVAFKYWVQKP